MIRRLPIEMLSADPRIADISQIAPLAPGPLRGQKGDWRTSLFDKFIPTGGADVSDDDKKRLFRQGLLQLAVGLQSSSNPSVAFANGISGGLLSMNQGVGDIQDHRYKQQALDQRLQDPTELRTFNAMTDGMSAEDKQKARRIALGLDGKTSGAAIQYKVVPDKDGRPQIVAVDPREVGAQIIGSGDSYGTGVMPAPTPMPAPTTGGGGAVLQEAGTPFYQGVEASIAPYGGILGSTNGGKHNTGSLHYSGNAVDIPMGASASAEAKANADRMRAQLEAQGYVVRDERTRPQGQAVWSGPHLHVERPQNVAQAGQGGNPFVGQSVAEKAAAEAQAKAAVELKMQPQIEAAKTAATIDTTNSRGSQTNAVAANKEQMTTEAAAAGTRNAKLAQKASDATQQLPVLSEIKRLLPFATNGVVDNMKNRAAGFFGASTSESQTDAKLRPLASRILQTVPRFEGPQSDKDVQSYKDAAGDLANPDLPRETRLAALAELERLARKAAGPQGTSDEKPRRLKFNPATGRLE